MSALWLLLLLFAPPAMAATPPRNAAGAELFARPAVRQIFITIPDDRMAALRTNARSDVAGVFREGTNVFPRVAIHLKGSSGSFRKLDDKPSLTVDFDKFDPNQRFYGLSKIHLNNSVEDPSYMHELIGSEAFNKAGIPAGRVIHALVELNGRKLGLYVLKEGFTTEFLGLHFLHPNGNLYEPGRGRDVNEALDQQLGSSREAGPELAALAAAAEDPTLARRWQRLERILDIDRFITFMAMEILLVHRDGYCLARNNFRIYHDVDSGHIVFLPHGMDQLFGNPRMPVHPRMNGLVARAIMEMPQGRQRYRDRCADLLTNVLVHSNLTGRIDQAAASLQGALPPTALAALAREVISLKERIAQRLVNAEQQLRQAPLEVLRFQDSTVALQNWQPVDIPAAGALFRTNLADGKPALMIEAGPVTFASWRSKVILPRGRYRFEGRLRTLDVAPLSFGKNHGATLRASTTTSRAQRWIGTQPWQQAAVTFGIGQTEQEIDLICELRATRGKAFFDLQSLRLVRLE